MADALRGADILDAEISKQLRIINPTNLKGTLETLWREGMPPGSKTGWSSLNPHYTVVPGQVTVVTGWPGSGKSEWVDALLVNLAAQGWRFAVFSPENMPVSVHAVKLMEKFAGRPFGAGPSERMAFEELSEHLDEVEQRFRFLEAGDEGASPQSVLGAAERVFAEFECAAHHGLVIDPWNELDHGRPAGLSETEYVSQTLSTIRRWARARSVHVWIIAHPQKMRDASGRLPIPRPDMIAGSQHWWNKADAAITVWRDFEKLDSNEVDVHIQKIRFKHVGRPGLVTLRYDRITGRYSDLARPHLTYRGARDGDGD